MYSTEVLKFNLCDFSNAYMLVKGNIIVAGTPVTQAAFKNYAPFTKCTTKTDAATIDNSEDLHLVVPMCNLIECRCSYS